MRIERRTCEKWSQYISTKEDGKRKEGGGPNGKGRRKTMNTHPRHTQHKRRSFPLHGITPSHRAGSASSLEIYNTASIS
jgi:hypothetical protein